MAEKKDLSTAILDNRKGPNKLKMEQIPNDIDDNSIFLNPTIDFSLTENTNLLIAAQIFTGDKNSLYNGVRSYVFTRLKWSF